MIGFNQSSRDLPSFLIDLDVSRYYYLLSLISSSFSASFLSQGKINETLGGLAISTSLVIAGRTLDASLDEPSRVAPYDF